MKRDAAVASGEDIEFLAAHGLNPEDTKVPEGHPVPLLWRVLVMPVQPRKKSAGGLILTTTTQENEAHLNYIGKVVAIGPLAGKSEKFLNPEWEEGPWSPGSPKANLPQYLWSVKVGDWIVYGRYAGQRMECRGVKLLMVNDDEILGVIADPEGFRVYA